MTYVECITLKIPHNHKYTVWRLHGLYCTQPASTFTTLTHHHTLQPVGSPVSSQSSHTHVHATHTLQPSHQKMRLLIQGWCSEVYTCTCSLIITSYGSTLYIGIAMVFVFTPYIRKFSSYFHFQLNFYDFIALNVLKTEQHTKYLS